MKKSDGWMSPFRKTLSPGFYWAKRVNDLPLELVEVRYKVPSSELKVNTMGWSDSEPIENFVDYIPAELKTPDGKSYKGVDEE